MLRVITWRCCVVLLSLLSFALLPAALRAGDANPDSPHAKAPPLPDPAAEMAGFRLAPGFTASLFAAEPLVQNPSAFTIDERGRFYVVEANRRRNDVLDMRNLPSWVEEDIACRTVEDRIAMVKRHLSGAKLAALTEHSDRIRLLEDRDGDGKADHDSVFADGFNQLETGTAAGVLARKGTVYFTEIPDLWMLRDTKGTGTADVRQSLAHGFGVRYNYSGHDMHGLRFGPDGRLYWSIADRALHVELKEGRVLDNPDSGAVLRCEPDGSKMEIFANGLRNPEDLAFDEHGNLFTGDNNSDAGDAPRWIYVVEGGDYGWRISYQWHTYPVSRGPWMNEHLDQVAPAVPAPARVPPIANPKISGPAGLTYWPGTGMPESFAHRFLLVDFRGSATGGSGIYALQNKPSGAGFELSEMKEFVTGVLPTDVEYGYDGGVYFSSWVAGWNPLGQGRLYHVLDPATAKDPLVAETRKLMSEGMEKRPPEELAKLLGHADVRVRMAAQFELAERSGGDTASLTAVATSQSPQLARLHAIWGLGQIARRPNAPAGAAAPLMNVLSDRDAEVRAQAAKVLGEAHATAAREAVEKLLGDKSPRVQMFAAQALGKIGASADTAKLLDLLRENADKDAFIRQAAVAALASLNDSQGLSSALKDESASVRLGALLALRRLKSPEVAKLLDDKDPSLVLEAARAINDVPIEAARPALAGLISRKGLHPFVLLRVVNANDRLGTPESASALATFALRSDVPDGVRAEALRVLGDWDQPVGRDRVTGQVLPPATRTRGAGRAPLASVLPEVLKSAPDAVRVAGLLGGASAGVETRSMFDIVTDAAQSPGVRSAAIGAMATRKDPHLPEAVQHGLVDASEVVRIAAIRAAGKLSGGALLLRKFVESGSPREQQAVFQTLGNVVSKDADDLLLSAFDRLAAGKLAPEARLDLTVAAGTRKKGSKVLDRLKAYEQAQTASLNKDPLAAYRDCLVGGDATQGSFIFHERQDVSCMRCHSIHGVGGNAGPDLAGVTTRVPPGYASPREYLLESILYPNKRIAPGFETVTVRTDDDVISGILKGEDANEVRLDVPNQGIVKIEKSTIKARRGGMSAMPEDISKTLSKKDVRDLIEFLSGQ